MRSILVIEDDDSIRETLQEALAMEGYEVLLAANGKEALDIIHDGARPGLALLDLMMPVMDGWHFLEELDVHMPIVVVSAYVHGAKTMTAAALLRRPVGFMTKPINLDTLLEVVRTYCSDDAREAGHAQ